MKKFISVAVAAFLAVASLAGCDTATPSSSSAAPSTPSSTAPSSSSTAPSTPAGATGAITVITREDGSGTRGAFVEIVGVVDADGNDATSVDAVAMDGTGKVMTAVSEDAQAMGYISLGSLNDTVKAIAVDGVLPSVETILDGTYKVARPFNIATPKGATLDPVTTELLAFCFTQEAQDIAAEEGFVPVEVTTADFASTQPTGTITVGGSTSVSPLMEKLIEAYKVHNPNATINLESVGSSAGMDGAETGAFNIGMASRDMKDSEKEVLDGYVLAMDGIAVVVNNTNTMEGLAIDQIKDIYLGNIVDFEEIA